MPKLLVGKDPYREAGTLPWQEDYGKHYYSTLAMLREGRHAGMVGVFSKTTIKSEEVPYFMFFPVLDKETSNIVFLPETGITYRSLSQRHPFNSGWWPLHGREIAGLVHRQNKQWKVGMHHNNTHLSLLTVESGLRPCAFPDRVYMESDPDSCLALEIAAWFNTFGEPKYPNTLEEIRAAYESWDKEGPIILGRRTAACNSMVYYLGITKPVAVVTADGEILIWNETGERVIGSSLELPTKSISKTAFGKEVNALNKKEGPKRKYGSGIGLGDYSSFESILNVASEGHVPTPSNIPDVIYEFFNYLEEPLANEF